jgi:hypothetical protein
MFYAVLHGPLFQTGRVVAVFCALRDAQLYACILASNADWGRLDTMHWTCQTHSISVEERREVVSTFSRPELDKFSVPLANDFFKIY